MGSKSSAKVYDYLYALDYALCQGPLDSINYVWIKDKRAFCGAVTTRQDICIDDDDLFGGDTAEGGIAGVIECYMGDDGQSSSVHLARRMGFDEIGNPSDLTPAQLRNHYEKAPAYSGIAHLFFRKGGLDRGGFKWGTNNPYLPGVKVSVTRIPRQLDSRWASIRPLNAVYADGQQPDQQPVDSYASGAAYPITEDDAYSSKGIEGGIRIVNGGLFSYLANRFVKQGEFIRVAALERVGVCDIGYKESGFMQNDSIRLLDEKGEPVSYDLAPAEAIATGAAYFEVEMISSISEYAGIIGSWYPDTSNDCVVIQYADAGNDTPGEQVYFNWMNAQNAGKWRFAVHPRCRFVKMAMSLNPAWISNKVRVDKATFSISWPEIGYAHCEMDDSIGDLPDANPAHYAYELLLDSGERENDNAADYIDAARFRLAAETLFKEGFGISVIEEASVTRQELLKKVADHIRGAIYQNPRTGKWDIALFRNDYNFLELPVITTKECKIVSGSRRAWSECISEITVEYTNPKEEKTASVTAHNDVGAAITGNRVPEVRSYQFIRNDALAQIVANRDVIEASYPLWNGTLRMSRKYWDLTPGKVLRLNYVDDDFQIAEMVVRVLDVKFGEINDRHIMVDVVEDIYGVDKMTYQEPQRPIVDPADAPKPTRLGRPQYIIPTTLPKPFIEKYGLRDNIDDDVKHYRTVFFGSIDYDLEQVKVYTRNFTENTQKLSYTVNPVNVYRMTESLNAEEASFISRATIERAAPRGLRPGGFLMISPDISSEQDRWNTDIERLTEIIQLIEYDNETGRWKVKRAVFDTVTRAWSAGALIWDLERGFDNAPLISEVLDPDEDPYPFWCKTVSNGKTTSDRNMWKLPVNTTARNHLPHRPGWVTVNGFGPEAFIDTALNSDVEMLNIVWAFRNSEYEEASPPWWRDGNTLPIPGQTFTVRFRDPDDPSKIRHEQTGITSFYVDIPVSATAPRGVVLVEVWAVDSEGVESLMASQNYVQIDKVALEYQGWDYQFGRNWSGTAII